MAKPLLEAGPGEIDAFRRRMHRDLSLGRITKEDCSALERLIYQIMNTLQEMKEKHGNHTEAEQGT